MGTMMYNDIPYGSGDIKKWSPNNDGRKSSDIYKYPVLTTFDISKSFTIKNGPINILPGKGYTIEVDLSVQSNSECFQYLVDHAGDYTLTGSLTASSGGFNNQPKLVLGGVMLDTDTNTLYIYCAGLMNYSDATRVAFSLNWLQ